MPGATAEDVRRCECQSDEDHPHIEVRGTQVRGCPFDMQEGNLRELMQLARSLWWVEQGVLPEAGGLSDQSASYVDAAEELLVLRQEITESKD